MKRDIPWLAYFLAVVNATIIGLSFMFTKIAVSLCAPFDTLAFRFLIGLAAFMVYTRLAGTPAAVLPNFRRCLRLIPIVLFYPLGFFTFQAFGLLHLPSSEAGILSASAPILTAILAAVFIGERTNVLQFLSICVSISGVLYIAWMKGDGIDPSHAWGILLILLSCLSSAGYTICNRVLVRSFTPSEITFALMAAGALFFTGISLFEHVRAGTLSTIFQPWADFRFVAAVFYLGIFASLTTTVLASLILKRISSFQLVVFFNLATVVSILAGRIFLDENIYSYHIIGTAIIVSGVIGTNCFRKRAGEEDGTPS